MLLLLVVVMEVVEDVVVVVVVVLVQAVDVLLWHLGVVLIVGGGIGAGGVNGVDSNGIAAVYAVPETADPGFNLLQLSAPFLCSDCCCWWCCGGYACCGWCCYWCLW
jgi:hypothetical protein